MRPHVIRLKSTLTCKHYYAIKVGELVFKISIQQYYDLMKQEGIDRKGPQDHPAIMKVLERIAGQLENREEEE